MLAVPMKPPLWRRSIIGRQGSYIPCAEPTDNDTPCIVTGGLPHRRRAASNGLLSDTSGRSPRCSPRDENLSGDLDEVEQVRRYSAVRQYQIAAETNSERPRHRRGLLRVRLDETSSWPAQLPNPAASVQTFAVSSRRSSSVETGRNASSFPRKWRWWEGTEELWRMRSMREEIAVAT